MKLNSKANDQTRQNYRNIMEGISEEWFNSSELHSNGKVRAGSEFERKLITALKVGFCLLDERGFHVHVNPAFCTMTGYSEEELIGIGPPYPYWPEEEYENLEAALNDTLHGRFRDFDLIFKRKNGERFPVLFSPSSVADEKGDVLTYLATVRDISTMRRIEDSIRRSEERLRQIYNSSLDAIYTTTLEGRTLEMNAAGVSMLGFDNLDELRKVNVETLYVYPDDRRRIIELVGQGPVRDFETKLRRKDGAMVDVIANVYLAEDDSGKTVMQGSLTNVTSLKRVEEARRRYEETLLTLHKHAFELASATTLDDIIKHTLDAMEYTLGFDTIDFSLVENRILRMKGSRGLKITLVEQPINGHGITVKAVKTKMTQRIPDTRNEPEYMDLAGASAPEYSELSELAVPVKIDDEVVGVLNVGSRQLHHFTEEDQRLLETLAYHVGTAIKRMQMEQLLLKNERLAAIGETAAMVGHDLRNPLQGIAGAAYNIKRHLRNLLDASTMDMFAVIDDGIGYANRVISDLLDFSREVHLEPVDTTPHLIVSQALTDIKVPDNVRIEDSTANTPKLFADESKMRRVLMNILENAVQAMPEGGRVTISSSASAEEFAITVTDTGVGISPEHLTKIWEPLFTTKAKGIGLGLAVSKRIVEAHGGSISVESTVGKGTSFTLKLPIVTTPDDNRQGEL